jgi:uncharacterized protein (TIGR03437 family)
VLAVQPGIFTTNGADAIVVHNADYSLVTEARPLVRGEYAFLYVTGLGAVDNAPATGAAAPRSPLARIRAAPAVTIDGVACEVLFAGLAPDFVALYQVNFRVAEGVSSGVRNIVVSAGGVSSKVALVPVQ